MPGRKYSNDNQYRYGFNGKENDAEAKGTGTQYDYGFRVYDSRLGKFLSVDPLTKSFPMLTPYQFASNTPISGIDLDGKEFLSINSSIYKMKYMGYTIQKITYDRYVIDQVVTNIPDAIKDPVTQLLKQTQGFAVSPFGRDWNPSIDGAIMYNPARYHQKPPEFFGDMNDLQNHNAAPSVTSSTQGLYSFQPDIPTNLSTAANAARSSQFSAGAKGAQHGVGIVLNHSYSKQSAWKAYSKEKGDRFWFYQATNIVDGYLNNNNIGDKTISNGQGRSDLINFLTDGSLPMGNSSANDLSFEKLEYNLRVIFTGVQMLSNYDPDGYWGPIRTETINKFNSLNEVYKKSGGTLNFSRPELKTP